MFSGSRLRQIAYLVLAGASLAAAGTLLGPLGRQMRRYELAPPHVGENHPEVALLTIAPGGLRAPVVNYLWIRANMLKQAGKYYDAKQLAGLICDLQPHFPSVWSFHSWNLAWNISVATQTPQERWLWIVNGMELLRDRGIPANPESLMLYRDLAWIFFSKIGGFSDDFNIEYKRRWAADMQKLLGAPPPGGVEEYVEAFRPITEAPVDKSLSRQGAQLIQPDQRAKVLAVPDAAALADELAKFDIKIDQSLLGAYNRYTQDQAVAVTRARPVARETERDEALFQLINAPDRADALERLLSFVRAQLLWNRYKLDPQKMLETMQRYEAPMDWRLPWPHAIYWANLGLEVTGLENSKEVRVLNTDRIVLNSLKQLSWRGRLTLIENPAAEDQPFISLTANWRFVEPTHQEFLRFIHAMQEKTGFPFKNNPIHTGHATFLENAVTMLVAAGRIEQADRYYQFLKTKYEKSGGPYENESVRDYVLARLTDPKEGYHNVSSIATTQISIALERAFIHLARGETAAYRRSMAYARAVYDNFVEGVAQRLELPPFNRFAASVLRSLLIEPRAVGYNLSLSGRSRMYQAVGVVQPQLQAMIWDSIAPALAGQCATEGIDFAKAFAPPPGMESYRRRAGGRLPQNGS